MRSPTYRNLAWILLGLGCLAALGFLAARGQGGPPDPTDPTTDLSHGAVIVDSGILVFREGLETILVLAAVTAGLLAGNQAYRRPVAAGGLFAFAATVVTWFVAIWAIGQLGGAGLDLQAATGLLAIGVLLLVMKWLFHRVYWTGWIAHHHRRRRRLLESAGEVTLRRTILGLALLGFTSVYREGFEIVLFLQSLRLEYGASVVLQGVAVGLLFTTIVGVVTFRLSRRLPYRRLLTLTGVLLGVVLLVMVGENVQEMQLAGWIGTTPIGIDIPGWIGTWFAVFPNLQTFVAQGLAALLVVGSYLLAEEVRVKRPRRRGERAAERAAVPPPRPIGAGEPEAA